MAQKRMLTVPNSKLGKADIVVCVPRPGMIIEATLTPARPFFANQMLGMRLTRKLSRSYGIRCPHRHRAKASHHTVSIH